MEIRVKNKNLKALYKSFEESKFKDLCSDLSSYASMGQLEATRNFLVPVTPSAELFDFVIENLALSGETTNLDFMKMQKIVFESGDDAKINSTKGFRVLITKYLTEKLIDGWLYKRTSFGMLPYLFTSIEQVSSQPQFGIKAGIKIRLNYASPNSEKTVDKVEISIDLDKMKGRTLVSILSDYGFTRETEELKSEYLHSMDTYQAYQNQYAKQFTLSGDSVDLHGGVGSTTHTSYEAKVINNEGKPLSYIPNKVSVPMFRGSVSSFNNQQMLDHLEDIDMQVLMSELNEDLGIQDDSEYEAINMPLPYHPLIKVFNLETHRDEWVLSTSLTPYEYDESVADKLVLPKEHRDLIDVLVNEGFIVLEDIVKGKSGGTVILCKGEPGLGKTLTAQVYSETVKKPLYSVHSGQLGTCPSEMDKTLKTILRRSEAWGSILVLDESDVFTRKRGNDIQHNAIVASFLRQLEASNGIVFLTTNRSDDVDDAILSRCSAIIEYKKPDTESAIKIWNILSKNYDISMSKSLIEVANKMYPNATGRDIKEILKLCSRFKSQGYEIDKERLRICGMFRAMIPLEV